MRLFMPITSALPSISAYSRSACGSMTLPEAFGETSTAVAVKAYCSAMALSAGSSMIFAESLPNSSADIAWMQALPKPRAI